MNREIKFKVWHEGYKKMTDNIHYMYHSHAYFKGQEIEIIDFSSRKIKLLQYTGLKDSKGNEIYEGDIVKCEPMCFTLDLERLFIGEIKFYECCYWIDNDKEAILLFSESNEIEIIGNIYENPELLK